MEWWDEIEEYNIIMKIYFIIQSIFFFLTKPLWWLGCKIEDRNMKKLGDL